MGANDLSRRAFLTGNIEKKMTLRNGGHGDKVSLLGYGMMRLPTADGGHANSWSREGYSAKGIDQEMVNRQIDYALEHGVNYFDTSPAYCRGESERVTGNALSRHPRKSYFIATKLSNFSEQTWSLEASKAMFEKSLKELKVDYIDYYLLHSIGNACGKYNGFESFKKRYVENGAIEWLVEERKAGRVRNLGFSFHGDVRAFNWCMDRHEEYHWDFCQIQLNYVDWKHAKELNVRNENAEWLYNELDRRGIPVVVMEPLLGGRLARFDQALAALFTPLDPEASFAKWALRFAGHYPRIATCLSGMTRMEHLEENCEIFSPHKPLSTQELAVLDAAAKICISGKRIPCTSCQYCMPCPYGLDIPGIFDVWNRAFAEGWLPDNPSSADFAKNRLRFLREYNRMVPPLRQANHCVTCGICAPHCPQSISIPDRMTVIDDFVEQLKRGIEQ